MKANFFSGQEKAVKDQEVLSRRSHKRMIILITALHLLLKLLQCNEILLDTLNLELMLNYNYSNAYTNRSDSGTVVLSYGQQNLLKRATFKCDSDIEKLSVKLWSEDNLIVDTKYMYEVMTMKAASLNDTLNYLGQTIIMKNQLEEPQNFNKSSVSLISFKNS